MYFELSRMDVYDDRPFSDRTKDSFVCQQPRLPIASFQIEWTGPVRSASTRTSLWNGETTWLISTNQGTLSFKSLANSDWRKADVMAFQFNSSASGAFTVSLNPKQAASTWAHKCPDYEYNPPADVLPIGHGLQGSVLRQRHLINTSHSTAMAIWSPSSGPIAVESGRASLPAGGTELAISISGVTPDLESSIVNATEQVLLAQQLGYAGVSELNAAWWHAYWPSGGFITLNESIVESFYYQQVS